MTTMYPPQNNGPHAVLAEAINEAVTSITVADASMLPAAPNVLTIGLDEDAELVQLQSKTGNILTVQRGYNGTTAKAWNAGEWVYRAITAQDIAALQEAAKQHDNTVTVMTADEWNALDTAARTALYTAGTRLVVVTTDDGAAIILSLNADGGTRKPTGADIPVSGTDATMIAAALEGKQEAITSDNAATVRAALELKNGALLRVECGSVTVNVPANESVTESILFSPSFAEAPNVQLTLTTSVDPKYYNVCISSILPSGFTIKVSGDYTAPRNVGVHWQASSEE